MQAEYRQALQDLQHAQQNFENAAPEFIDAAIYNLIAAETKVAAIVNQNKRGEEERCSLAEESNLQVQLQ